MNQNNQQEQKLSYPASARFIQGGVIAFTLVVLTALTMLWWVGAQMQEKQTPLAHAGTDLKYHLATFHLWFEELVQQDETITRQDVWQHLAEARWYAHAMLEGGSNPEVTILPLKSPSARQAITLALQQMERLEKAADKRLAHIETAGTSADQAFDALFFHAIEAASQAEKQIIREIDTQALHYHWVAALLEIMILLLALFVGVLFWHHDKRHHQQERQLREGQDRLGKLLDSAKQSKIELAAYQANLEKLVEERTAELQQTTNRLKDAQRLVHLGNWERHFPSDTAWWSEEIFHILGRPPQPKTSFSQALEYIHPQDREYVIQTVEASLKPGAECLVEYRIVRPNGEIRHVHSQGRVTQWSDTGEPIRMAGALQDITERIVQDQAFRDSEERLQIALDAANLGLWDWYPATDKAFFNSQWLGQLGYLPGEIEPSGTTWKKLLHPEDWPQVSKALEAHIAKESSRYQVAFRLKTKQGSWKWILAYGLVTEWDESGAPLRMTGVHIDIDEAKKSEINLRRAKQKAEEATQLKDKFLSLVAHDLRSPLSSMVGLLELITADRKNPPHENHVALIEDVLSSGHNLIHLIEEVLNISRLKSGKITLKKVFFDGHYVVAETAARLEYLYARKNITLALEIPEGTRLHGDPLLFGEVIQNLLTNAIKFSHPGGTIRLYLPAGEKATIAVEDQGVGLDGEVIPKLFRVEEKTTTPGTSGESGTGFGLPFSQDIMIAHGGRIEVTSNPGQGSTFKASLPWVRPRVMVVDDQAMDQRIMAAILTPLDVEIIAARSGSQALEMASQNRPHLILSDISMPEMDGFGLLAAIRKNPDTSDIPVILITGDDKAETRDRAFGNGAADFATKPIVHHDFLPRVKYHLGG
ncbi:MAG: PAS domain-containing protein [Magnetococcales bacterium]|nr:PAS domain-containing protein [Magnetococcales bacterium]